MCKQALNLEKTISEKKSCDNSLTLVNLPKFSDLGKHFFHDSALIHCYPEEYLAALGGFTNYPQYKNVHTANLIFVVPFEINKTN